MRSSQTRQPPLIDVMRPIGPKWEYTVTLTVSSSGYVNDARVMSFRSAEVPALCGIATCPVGLYDPLGEVLEFLAVEAMLAACEPTLFDAIPLRRCTFEPDLH